MAKIIEQNELNEIATLLDSLKKQIQEDDLKSELEKEALHELIQLQNSLIENLKSSLIKHKEFIHKYAVKEFSENFFNENDYLSQNFISFIQLGSESGTNYDSKYICGSTIRTYNGFKSDFQSEDQTYGRRQFPKSELGEFILPIPRCIEEFRKDAELLEK